MPELIIHPNAPSVVSEIIDGEAVIMNLKSGHYFSTQLVGGELWALIEAGTTESHLIGFLRRRYAITSAEATSTVASFLGQLREHSLVVEEAGRSSVAPADASTDSAVAPFVAPVLNVYSDMEDLLLLDPIHDVAEAGWPMPKPADT